MKIEWDPAKAKPNRRKHDIDFADAATVLFDELAVTVRDDSGEDDLRDNRVGCVGACSSRRFAWAEDVIRLISARKATKRERRQYEEKT